MSYISARNWRRILSRIGCHRLRTESKLIEPGLRRSGSVRESLPIEYCAGFANAVVSNHAFMLCWPAARFPSFRRFAVHPMPDTPGRLHEAPIEMGVPVCITKIPVACQLPRIQLPI